MGGASDEALFQTIRKGVPGSEMPASNRPDHEILQIMAYLRNMNAVAPADSTPAGNVANGGASVCQAVRQLPPRGWKGRPNWPRSEPHRLVRARATALVREIRTPSEVIPPAWETVTVATKDGQKVRGIKKNEDAFSIQLMDMRERIQGYSKANVEVTYDKDSLMPAFDPKRLSDSDLSDLVGYLSTLRGS